MHHPSQEAFPQPKTHRASEHARHVNHRPHKNPPATHHESILRTHRTAPGGQPQHTDPPSFQRSSHCELPGCADTRRQHGRQYGAESLLSPEEIVLAPNSRFALPVCRRLVRADASICDLIFEFSRCIFQSLQRCSTCIFCHHVQKGSHPPQ
jgi:hypothetical protein